MLKDAWTLAIETLAQVELRKLSERLALAKTMRHLDIQNQNAIRYAYALLVETVRQKNLIDKFIESVIHPQALSDFSIGVQAFLELYVYQTRARKNWTEPDLQEAQRIAKLGRSILGWKNLRVVEQFLGFLLTKQIESILNEPSDRECVALRTFHPTWFVNYCFKLFSKDDAIAFLEGSIYPPPVFVRLNTLRAPREEIIAKLESEGVKLEKTEQLENVFKVLHAKNPLTRIASYCAGLFYIQDKASCFAAQVAEPKPDTTVLDVCAAPGAKTTHLAQLMQNHGVVYSLDFSARRMQTWKQETQRMGAILAEPIIADARLPLPFSFQADLVVLDPPCTSTGVFGRQPSTKWRLTLKSIERMAEIQFKMINTVADHVKSGGCLTYSTCSITVEENEMVVERFLKLHPNFRLDEVKLNIGQPGLRGLVKCRRLYPHIHESNGFFIAKLAKD